ncbi:MAG: short chain dehydrogenase [Bacteroidetes bacterium HGW-Bacteroidetes-12]|nr:MAG: short chain dehydrogenase [Bacteroidetes bacterium HGW-Bacteroidetes-12]
MNLTNKVVWITGASSGIGEATVYELAKKDCRIILSARRKDELIRVQKNANLTDENALILPIDLENYSQATHWVQQVIAKFNRIDILINNGGISQKSEALATSETVEKKIMNINYFGNVALTKVVLPIMQQQKNGKIVVVTSILGKFGLPQLSTYAASKHALYGFYESLRLELVKDNIHILIVSPGFINTNVSLNAIDGNGNSTNENSDAQLNGMKATTFAKKFVAAITSNKKHQYIGNKELLSIPFKTLFPSLFYKIMLKMSNKNK